MKPQSFSSSKRRSDLLLQGDAGILHLPEGCLSGRGRKSAAGLMDDVCFEAGANRIQGRGLDADIESQTADPHPADVFSP